MWKARSVCVILPAFNEEKSVGAQARAFLQLRNHEQEKIVDKVLVVDNNSTDATAERARAAGGQVVKEGRQGYGFALRRGLLDATTELVVLCEPDGTFAAEDLPNLLELSRTNEMVVGTRTTCDFIAPGANMRGFLRWGNIALAKVFQVLYRGPSLSDCGCTYRVIHGRVIPGLLDRLSEGGSAFLMNLSIAARLEGLSVVETPVHYGPRIGQSKITGNFRGTLRTGMAMFRVALGQWPSFVRERLLFS